MLPFTRILQYGNTVDHTPKIKYNFSNSTAVSIGKVTGSISGGTYLTIPVSGYTTGIMGATLTLPQAIVLGTSDYSIESVFYLNTTASGYSPISNIGTYTGIRYGDSGFGNRLQFASSYAGPTTVYSTDNTRTSTYQQVIKIKTQRISNVIRVYINDVQVNFAVGQSSSYTNSEIVDNISIGSNSTITFGATNLALISCTIDY